MVIRGNKKHLNLRSFAQKLGFCKTYWFHDGEKDGFQNGARAPRGPIWGLKGAQLHLQREVGFPRPPQGHQQGAQ